MVQEGNTQRYVARLKDTIKKNEKKKSDYEKQISALEEQLKDHNENCVVKINDLKRKIEKLERENDDLRHQITDLKESNDFLDERVKQLEKNSEEKENKLKEFHEKIRKFEMSEDQLCIGQLLNDVEKNFCKLVLKEFYDEHGDHNTKYMPDHIQNLIDDEIKRQEAKERWKTLQEQIRWDPYIKLLLKPLKEKRNDLAHPTLTEESIGKAKESLMKKKQLNKKMSEAVDTLTSMWKQTNSKLQAKKPEPESVNEKQARGTEGV